jgi:hypothetical protein
MINSAPDSQIPHKRGYYVYKCRVCGFENRKKAISGSEVPVVKKGDYGSNATPQPVTYVDEMYEATTISFVAAAGSVPAYLADSAYQFGEKHFTGDMTLRVATTSGENDGDYTIATRWGNRGEILLIDSDSLTTEDAATAGTVTLSRIIYQPFTSTSGCPFCGTLRGT